MDPGSRWFFGSVVYWCVTASSLGKKTKILIWSICQCPRVKWPPELVPFHPESVIEMCTLMSMSQHITDGSCLQWGPQHKKPPSRWPPSLWLPRVSPEPRVMAEGVAFASRRGAGASPEGSWWMPEPCVFKRNQLLVLGRLCNWYHDKPGGSPIINGRREFYGARGPQLSSWHPALPKPSRLPLDRGTCL